MRKRNKRKNPSPQQTGKGCGRVTYLRGSGFHQKEEFLSLPQGQAQALVCPDSSGALGLSRSPCVDDSHLGLRSGAIWIRHCLCFRICLLFTLNPFLPLHPFCWLELSCDFISRQGDQCCNLSTLQGRCTPVLGVPQCLSTLFVPSAPALVNTAKGTTEFSFLTPVVLSDICCYEEAALHLSLRQH